MQKVCTRCNAHLVHSNRVENQVAILLYEFRETVPVNVALGQFFFKGAGSPTSYSWPDVDQNNKMRNEYMPKIQNNRKLQM